MATFLLTVLLFGPVTAPITYALSAPSTGAADETGQDPDRADSRDGDRDRRDRSAGHGRDRADRSSNRATVQHLPTGLTAKTVDGIPVSLDRNQLRHAATIISVGSRTKGVGRDGIVVALMASLTESHLQMLANPGAYPASVKHPHDGVGQDFDSLGLFQMRPASGWGSVKELMQPEYQAAAFFGGPNGPNNGSPRGLLDIDGWKNLHKGAAAQAVEVSAYPYRYAQYKPVALAILDQLTPARGR
ncbi:hypothetical protein [Promicromonospora sukumoe]|uniref:Transglycosylase-like protein with SLT domain n=1 Tax=Promicromonospora sukumoe TaxID=88382 RepID=A0A7W3J8Q7_9MICO|nr:hypothetical protein [Promicromonospora sukumoe]MBA8808356.1 hypothetical protein [Promicromonospora sukumoe]